MIETVKDKDSYERLIVDSNRTTDGWYSEDEGQVSIERVDEMKKIQSELREAGIIATLKEGEYCWVSFCTDVYCATWIPYPHGVVGEFVTYAKDYFQIVV